MLTEFVKQKPALASLLGGELVEYDSAMVIPRRQLTLQFYEHPNSQRPLELRIIARLDDPDEQATGRAARPRIDGRPEITVRRKTEAEREGKRSRLDRHVQTGDADFDSLVHIESDAPDEPIRTVLSEDTRRIVKGLLEGHCALVAINVRKTGPDRIEELVVEFRAPEPDAESLPRLIAQLERVFDQVASLRGSLPLFVGDAKAVRRFPRVAWAYRIVLLLLLSSIGSCGAAGILEYMPIDQAPIFIVLSIGIGSAVLFIPLALLIARGHPRGASHFRWLIVLGFIAFPPSAFGFGFLSNAVFDSSEPRALVVTALADPKWCTQTAGNPSHSVWVRDWRDPTKTWVLNLSMKQCRVAKQGDRFFVLIKKGFWGWPWVDDVRAQR